MGAERQTKRVVLFFTLAILCLLAAGVVWMLFRPAPPPQVERVETLAAPEPILVDDFEIGQTSGLFAQRKNRLDAFQGTWARRPSYTVITKVLDTRPGGIGDALRLEYAKEGGWCGWYTLLNGVDISRHNALTFWVRGEQGGERFDIGMADEKMQELEIDAVYVGPIQAFLPEGVTPQWQQVKIPLQSLKSELDLTRMGSLVFWFRYEGSGAIQVDDVMFVYDEEVERILEENQPRAERRPGCPRAMWIWKYDPVNNLEVRGELFTFCGRTAIERIYLYLGEEPLPKTPPEYQEKLAQFLKECHAMGVEVQALQGNPLWALKAYHPRVLEWVSGFLEFNRLRPLEDRMDGVHMDIEPYLTADWETGDREKLQEEFLELLSQCRALVDGYNEEDTRAVSDTDLPADGSVAGTVSDTGFKKPWAVGPLAKVPFVMGLAIPIFYDREPQMEERLLQQLHYAALMDYYDTAADIIRQGTSHLKMADRLGVQMVIGVETQDLVQMKQGKRRNTFIEEGWGEMERELAQVADAFSGHPSFDGVAIHAYYSYRVLQRGRNVPTRERTGKVPGLTATQVEVPVSVDGNLAEWDEALWTQVNHRDQAVYGAGAWEGPADFSFRAAFRWEPEGLVIAMDVTDNVILQEKRGADMWEGDHFEVWVDVDLESDYTEAVNSADDFQLGFSPGNFDGLPPEVHVWVPGVAPESVGQVQIAAQKKPEGDTSGYTMEVRLPTAFLFQNVVKRVGVEPIETPGGSRVAPEVLVLQQGVLNSGELTPGFRIGLMMDGSDSDSARAPQKCMLSTSEERQWGDPTTFNVLEFQ